MEKAVSDNNKVAVDQADNTPSTDLQMRGRFTQYISPFLQFFGPLISLRYLGIAFEKINPFGVIDKKYTPRRGWNQTLKEGLTRNMTALGMGALLLTGVGLYSKRTYDDMRTLYAGAVGYELDKKPEDVTLHDIFTKSRNAAVQVTARAFLRRTAMRVAAAASFLMPWHKLTPKANTKPIFDANIDAGVGIAGLYVSSEGWLRTQSYFDLQQYLVDTAITHASNNIHDTIQPNHIQSLLFLQRKHLDKNYKRPLSYSQESENEKVVAERIAALMNQTYKNAPKTGPADFTISKFNFLVGFGLLEEFPSSLGFVELANRSADMQEVKAAADAIKNGQNPEDVFRTFGIDITNPVKTGAPSAPAAGKFTSVTPAKEKITAKSLLDFATAPTADRTPSC